MSNTPQQFQPQVLQEIVGVVVALAFIAMVILDVVKKFKEVTQK
jgi:hypothetical protein